MNGKIEIELNGIKVTVLGGPYREKPRNVKGIKLAQEVKAPADILLNIPDFSVPTVDDTVKALREVFTILRKDRIIYVGCMGGIGRTGMFMALIALVASVDRLVYPPMRSRIGKLFASLFNYSKYLPEPKWCRDVRSNPISFIRSVYIPNAVETKEQKDFICLFPVMEKITVIKPNGTNPFADALSMVN